MTVEIGLRKLKKDGKLGKLALYNSGRTCDNVFNRSRGYTNKHIRDKKFIVSSNNGAEEWYIITRVNGKDVPNVKGIAQAFYRSGVLAEKQSVFRPGNFSKFKRDPAKRAKKIKLVRSLLVRINLKYDDLNDAARHHDSDYKNLVKTIRTAD